MQEHEFRALNRNVGILNMRSDIEVFHAGLRVKLYGRQSQYVSHRLVDYGIASRNSVPDWLIIKDRLKTAAMIVLNEVFQDMVPERHQGDHPIGHHFQEKLAEMVGLTMETHHIAGGLVPCSIVSELVEKNLAYFGKKYINPLECPVDEKLRQVIGYLVAFPVRRVKSWDEKGKPIFV